MRIAHICTKFNRVSETFVYDIVTGLERTGVENHVLTAERVNALERPFARVQVLPFRWWRKAAFAISKHCLDRYTFTLPARATRHALGDIHPGAILAHFGGAGVAIAPVARELGIPLVVVFHAFDLFARHCRPAMYAPLWESGAYAVAISEHGKRRLLDVGCPPDRIRLIHCGVDAVRFAQPDAPRSPEGNNFRLIGIGRLVEKKGFDDLIRAMVILRPRLECPVLLDIWGDGPAKRDLEKLVRELGLRDVVTFKGAAASENVPSLMRQHDACVLSSKTARNGDTEGIPITILEAQAAGLPVVSTLHGGIPEAVPPANRGLLVREGDVEDLARVLLSLASRRDRWRRIGLCGREWVREHFSLHAEIAAYRRLFQEVAAPCP